MRLSWMWGRWRREREHNAGEGARRVFEQSMAAFAEWRPRTCTGSANGVQV